MAFIVYLEFFMGIVFYILFSLILGMLEQLNNMNLKLEEIQKSLDMYLETKRQIFPRFYFLSNDDLLEILGQSKNPEAVQPHLKKCFDNIKSLKMAKVGVNMA
jgi:dynein heavy chain